MSNDHVLDAEGIDEIRDRLRHLIDAWEAGAVDDWAVREEAEVIDLAWEAAWAAWRDHWDSIVYVQGGWLRPTGERRGRYYVLGPRLLLTPASGEVPAIAGI